MIPVIALFVGTGLGAIYFQALWFTVRWLPRKHRQALWVIGGFFLRLGLFLAVFAWLGWWQGWPAVVVGLIGFFAVRTVLVIAAALFLVSESVKVWRWRSGQEKKRAA